METTVHCQSKNIYPDSHKFLIRNTKVNYPPFKCVHSCVVKGNIQELYSNPPIGGNQVSPIVIPGHHVPCLAHTRVDLHLQQSGPRINQHIALISFFFFNVPSDVKQTMGWKIVCNFPSTLSPDRQVACVGSAATWHRRL